MSHSIPEEPAIGKATSERERTLRRVKALKNQVNVLAFRCLWPADDADRDDAFDGLRRCCWRAKGNIYVAGNGCSPAAATEDFISGEIEKLLEPYRRMGRERIAALATDGAFKYLARTVRNHMRDHVREHYRAKEQPNGDEQTPPTQHEMAQVLADLAAHHALRDVIGLENVWILRAGAAAWPLPEQRRNRKAHITRAIASALQLSERQARARKTAFVRLVGESNDPALVAIRTTTWFGETFGSPAPEGRDNL